MKSNNLFIYSLAVFSFCSQSCETNNELAPISVAKEQAENTSTDLISMHLTVELHIPGVYVTSSSTAVGDCEEKKNNTCMIIRANLRPVIGGNTNEKEVESANLYLPDASGSFENSEPISVKVNSLTTEEATTNNINLINDYFFKNGVNNYNVYGFFRDDLNNEKLAKMNLSLILP